MYFVAATLCEYTDSLEKSQARALAKSEDRKVTLISESLLDLRGGKLTLVFVSSTFIYLYEDGEPPRTLIVPKERVKQIVVQLKGSAKPVAKPADESKEQNAPPASKSSADDVKQNQDAPLLKQPEAPVSIIDKSQTADKTEGQKNEPVSPPPK